MLRFILGNLIGRCVAKVMYVQSFIESLNTFSMRVQMNDYKLSYVQYVHKIHIQN
jgi:hypothetical protein